MTRKFLGLLLMATWAGSAYAGVTISAPSNGANVSSTVQFVASAIGCSKGVAAMGIYPSPYHLAYKVGGSKLNTELTFSAGTYNVVIQEWDNCGGNSTSQVKINVTSGGGGAGWVKISAPSNNSNDAQQVQFVASSGTGCSKGIAAMGVYSAPGHLIYTHNGSSLNAVLNFSPGTYNTAVQEWDNCGGSARSYVTINVGGSEGGGGDGHNFYDLQADGHWQGFGMLPPNYMPCTNCSPDVEWSMKSHVGSPSMDGNSSQFWIGGNHAFSDGFWNNHLIGDGGKIADPGHNIVPQYHNFVYDLYFFGSNIGLSQALEFDINQFVGGKSYIWGTECRIAGGNQWDIWDNQGHKWHPTGVPCYPNNNAWNHVTIKAQRTSDGHVLFQSITLNGKTANLNYYEWPTSTGWYGITVNYQEDGNYRQEGYSIFVDKMTFTYW